MANASTAACPKLMPTTSHGIWQGDNPFDFSLSLLIVQMILVLTVTRVLGLFLRPLRQPRVIAEIIGGILLGPSALGQNKDYMAKIFPKESMSILTTFANMGLMFFLFMVGLELDLASLRRIGKQAAAISAAGMSLPFAAGIGVSFVLHNTINPEARFLPFLVFMGVALSVTAFPVLARILAERRLLTTDVGKMAIAAAAGNDVVAWIFLALAVALSGSHSPAVAAWILLCGVAFVIAMFMLVKPVMTWMSSRSLDDQPVKELYICIALGGVLVSGFVTDFIGIHGIFGAFVFGLIIPDGHFAQALIEKIEDFVNILMLPLYFAASGLQTNIGAIKGAKSFGLLLLVIVTACGGKIIGTLVVSMAFGDKFRKSLTLGFLMNTKGLVELIVLNIGKERKVLNDEMFAIMVIMALFTTFITTPVVMALYKPARDRIPYKRRKLTNSSSSSITSGGAAGCAPMELPVQLEPNELRLMACVHGMKNVPSIMNLVEMTRGTNKKELMKLYVLHLVELSERSSAIMMARMASQEDGSNRGGSSAAAAAVVDGIGVAFGAFVQLNKVVVRSMTAISGLEDMHEDICATASNKRAAFVILPFHRYARADGVLEMTNSGFQGVNRRVLLHAPCSVGILVDRGALSNGIGLGQQLLSSNVDHSVAVLFFGGSDDREALELGLRMAEHPGVKLTVFRFVMLDPSTTEHAIGIEQSYVDHLNELGLQKRSLTEQHSYQFSVTGMDLKAEARLDEECIANVKQKLQQGDYCSISLEEKQGSDPIDAAMSVARKNKHGLLLVGRARCPVVPVSALSMAPAVYPELGPVGDALAATGEHTVLVVQQYDPSLVP